MAPGLAGDDRLAVAPVQVAGVGLAPVAVQERQLPVGVFGHDKAPAVELEPGEAVRRHLVDDLGRRVAAMVVPAEAVATLVDLEELVLESLAAQRPLGRAAVVVDLHGAQLVAVPSQGRQRLEECRQVPVEEGEIRIPVPGNGAAVPDTAEQQAEEQPIPVAQGRVRQDVVETLDAPLPARFERAPSEPRDGLLQAAHGT